MINRVLAKSYVILSFSITYFNTLSAALYKITTVAGIVNSLCGQTGKHIFDAAIYRNVNN